MRFYRFLSGISLLKKYNAKFMVIAFLGIHIPLLGVIAMLIATSGATINKVAFFLLTLGLTLLATGFTLFVLNMLVAPVRAAQKALSGYLDNQAMPQLPNDLNDEVGVLMRDINTVTTAMRNNIAEKDRVINTLSDNLRIPANNIRTLIQRLKEENDPATAAKYIDQIGEAARYQLKMIGEIAGTGHI